MYITFRRDTQEIDHLRVCCYWDQFGESTNIDPLATHGGGCPHRYRYVDNTQYIHVICTVCTYVHNLDKYFLYTVFTSSVSFCRVLTFCLSITDQCSTFYYHKLKFLHV